MIQTLIRRLTSTPTRRLVCMLGLSSAAGLAMLAFRLGYGGRRGYWSLPWDLFLAWVPVPLAFAVARLEEREKKPWAKLLLIAFLWLLFFPNAPYLVTEFMHLHPSHAIYDGFLPQPLIDHSPRGSIPVWFDVLMLSTYAWTGLLLGFVSLYVIHRTARRLAGQACGWATAFVGTTLCAFGVSLGRFERWNSWDLLTRPLSLLSDVFDRMINPLAHPRTLGATILLAGFLMLGYLSLVALTRLGSSDPAHA
jgi:uncharacterized membrane protein